MGGTDGIRIWDIGREGCDCNYEVVHIYFGMEWVHNSEPERNRVTS